jgi:hypothetical protein
MMIEVNTSTMENVKSKIFYRNSSTNTEMMIRNLDADESWKVGQYTISR